MSQASDLGAIANQLAVLYRARVNANLQALATQHYGATEPALIYPNMLWFDSGTGNVKLRNPTNTAWAVVGTIGPPFKWTSVDVPQNAWGTGEVKITYNPTPPAGWIMLNNGSIGNAASGAVTRAAPDCEALFGLMWNISVDSFCTVYAAGTWTPTGRGASAAADWAANRHILLPKTIGHVFGCWGVSALLGAALGIATWHGAHTVTLNTANLPAHTHAGGSHTHGAGTLTAVGGGHEHVETRVGPGGALGGIATDSFGLDHQSGAATTGGGAHSHSLVGETAQAGGGTTGSTGSGSPVPIIQPTTYANYIIKL